KHQQRFVWNKYKGKMARGRASITGKAEGINRKSKEEGVRPMPICVPQCLCVCPRASFCQS
ncbi:hypothetical protein KUCAC02_000861, partial [Chaenocephalus aceratus]